MNVNKILFTFVKILIMDSLVKRIELLLKQKKLNPSKFADEIGVQRSSISHIMSGRNKPSLDFILKILNSYNDINAEWLLKGVGTMSSFELMFDHEKPEDTTVTHKKLAGDTEKPKAGKRSDGKKKILKVLVFYDDQTFDEIESTG